MGLTDLPQLPLGVEVRTGICEQRPAWVDADGTPRFPGPDTAYRISQQAVLTVPTSNAFAGKTSYGPF